jgi:hypothetical protein
VTVLNCDCEAVSPYRTLLQLRTAVLRRAGYASQAANPPPGIADEIDECIRDAQRLLYRKHRELRQERFFRWTMVPNQRFYAFGDEDTGGDVDCNKLLEPNTITGVWLEDLNNAFFQLVSGINPEWYTETTQNGYPTNYEVRSCIEVFPAPRGAYKLWVRGRFGLEPLVADTDRTTIDDQGVYLLALGTFKKGRGKADADSILAQASTYEQTMVASTHTTRRYIPQTAVPAPLPMPVMTTFVPP